MAQVQVTINGRPYTISCEVGKEQHVLDIAAYVNGRVEEVARDLGQVGDARLLVLAALLIADELFEARDVAGPAAAAKSRKAGETEDQLSQAIDGLASRIEKIAARVERN
jgi:cell division protein ZapA